MFATWLTYVYIMKVLWQKSINIATKVDKYIHICIRFELVIQHFTEEPNGKLKHNIFI